MVAVSHLLCVSFFHSSLTRLRVASRAPTVLAKKLAKLRQREDTLKTGTTLIGRLVDGAFTVTRFNNFENRTTGNIYVAALNFAEHPVKLPMNDLPSNGKLSKATIVTATLNCETYYARQTVDFGSKEIQLEPNQGVVFRYPA